MAETGTALLQIGGVTDPKVKIEHYKQLLATLISGNNVEGLKTFAAHMVSDDVPLVASRAILQVFSVELSKLEPEAHKEVAQFALAQIQPRVVSFEEQVSTIREGLADLYEQEEEWSKAAQMLGGIDLDSGHRNLNDTYKLGKLVKVALLYLEDDDAVNAEIFIKKASFLVPNCTDYGLELQYKVCYARMLDSKRKFLEAALRYYELSQVEKRELGGRMVDEEELEQALTAAVTCTILAAAGPQRSRVLATLYKDHPLCICIEHDTCEPSFQINARVTRQGPGCFPLLLDLDQLWPTACTLMAWGTARSFSKCCEFSLLTKSPEE